MTFQSNIQFDNHSFAPYFMANPPIAQNWVARLLMTIAGVVILILGFFFLTVALVAGAILALIVGVRLWWRIRKLKRAANSDVVEGDYVVVERESTDRQLPRQ